MNIHAVRFLSGLVLAAFALWLASIAAGILFGVILPGLRAGPTATTHDTVIIAGVPLTGWGIYVGTGAIGIAALLLVSGGLYVAFSRPHET